MWLNSVAMTPDSKIHGANMGPIWGRQVRGGPHVGTMNFAICNNIFWTDVLVRYDKEDICNRIDHIQSAVKLFFYIKE